MTEITLRDAATAHDLRYCILRYFNVAGADPKCRTGQSTKNATHLIKVAVEAALELRPKLDIYGTDYSTPDGTCIRDYIHVSDLVRAHSDALRYLRAGSASVTLNCGYGHGFSVREVIEMVKRVSGVDFKVEIASRRPGDPAQIIAACDRVRTILGWTPQYDDLATIIAHALAWEQRKSTCCCPVMGRRFCCQIGWQPDLLGTNPGGASIRGANNIEGDGEIIGQEVNRMAVVEGHASTLDI